ncbi:MAG: polyprenol monophosphomannose synthase [Anaerolineae bacterium]
MPTVVVIPTYNERENIETLVHEVLALPLDLHIVVVDDNSPDGTGEVADALAYQYPEVHVIHRPWKAGLGSAYIAGFKRAIELEADLVMTMDADFSHQPRYIPELVGMTQEKHLVIGSRYVDGGGTLFCTVGRRLLSQSANTFARLMLNLQAHDCTAGFRCYRREMLESIDLDSIFSEGYSFLVEMLYKCQQRGYSIGEVPIIFRNREHGASKISRQEILKAIYTVLRLSLQRL